MTQDSVPVYLRHGQTPVFRLPTLVPTTTDAVRYADRDAVFLGVPYDSGTTYLPGARLGPYHLRRVSALVESYHPLHDVDVFGSLSCVDGGNVPAPPFNAALMREMVESEVAAILDAGAVPFVFGGDHSVSLPCLRAAARKHGPLALVHVDAHFDTSTSELWGESYHHGTPVRHALEEGLIARGQLYTIGVRGPWRTRDDAEPGARHGATVVTADRIADSGVSGLIEDIRVAIGGRPTYLTFDIDAVDPAFAPGTGTPVPGGLTAREALAVVRGLYGVNLVGMDIVELAPTLDHADITCLLAAHLLYEGLALLTGP